MAIPLEDNVSDIIGKAQRGLGISDSQLAERSGVKLEEDTKVCAKEILIDRPSSGRRPS